MQASNKYEPISAMLEEIRLMKVWAEKPENYANGYSTMVECWDDEDYESLFYIANYAAPQHIQAIQPRVRVSFAEAWEIFKRTAEAYADQEADARNSAF